MSRLEVLLNRRVTARPGKPLHTHTSEYLHGQSAAIPTRTLIRAQAEDRRREGAADAAERSRQARAAFEEMGRDTGEAPGPAAEVPPPIVTAFDAESADRVYAARRKRMER